MFERILVPLDGSSLSEQALPFAEEVARKFNAQLILLRATTSEAEALRETVAEPSTLASEIAIDVAMDRVEAEEDAAEDYLERIATRFRDNGLKVETRHLEGAAQWAILNVAAEQNVSLIVMASHGRGGLSRLVNGSVADHILRESSIPTMLIRVKK